MKNMKNNIYPCIWFDKDGKDAAQFYIDTFGDGKITTDTQMVVTFELSGQKFLALNGGPEIKPNPAVSYMVVLEDKAELENIWNRLSDGGKVLMPLDKYEWSEKYGWVQDKFGVSWQLYFGEVNDDVHGQKIIPTYMFTQEYNGKTEEALNFYVKLFKNSKLDGVMKHQEGDMKGLVMHAQCVLDDYVIAAMDGGNGHDFHFSWGNSMFIECETQGEIDHFWNAFAAGGEESQCGWVRDKFGAWWQVIPKQLVVWMTDPQLAPKVSEAFYKMKKIDIETLKKATEQ